MSSLHMAMSRQSEASCSDGSISIGLDEMGDTSSEQQRESQHSQASMSSLRKPSLTPDDQVECNVRVMTPQVRDRKGHQSADHEETEKSQQLCSSPAPRWDFGMNDDEEQPSQIGQKKLPQSPQQGTSCCYDTEAEDSDIEESPSPEPPAPTHRRIRHSAAEILGLSDHSGATEDSADENLLPGAVAVKSHRPSRTVAAAAQRVRMPSVVVERGPPLIFERATDPSLLMVSAHVVANHNHGDDNSDVESRPPRRTTTRTSDEIRQQILDESVAATEVKVMKRWWRNRKTWLLFALSVAAVVFVILCW